MKLRNRIALSFLALVLILLAFFQTPLMNAVRHNVWEAIISTTGQTFGLQGGTDDATIIQQLEQLQTENIRLKAQLADYTRIKNQLDTPALESLRPIPVAIVGRPMDTFHAQLIINKGLEDGIVQGAPAVIKNGILIGFVKEISEHTATIETLLAPSTHLAVETISEDKDIPPARGLLTSRYYTSLLMTTIPRDVPLKENQPVVTLSRDASLPYGLVVGNITHITNLEHEAYQEARISLPYDLDELSALTIFVEP